MIFRFVTGVVAIAGAAAAQAPEPQGGQPQMVRQMRPPPPTMTGDRAEVPFELAGSMPVITAMVNGRGPYRFGVDTGAAGYLRVSPALAQALGLEQVGEGRAVDPSGRNPVSIPVYRVDSLSFGGLTFGGVHASGFQLAGPRGAEVDGIIGVGFFERLLLTVDFGRRRLTAGPGALPEADGRTVLPVTFDRSLPSLPVRVGDREFILHLDLGNSVQPLILPTDAVGSLPTRGEPRTIGRARTVSQEVEIKAVDLAVPVRVGDTVLPVTSVAYPAVAPPGNLGSMALQTMAVTLDYANARVRIVPSQP